MSEDAPAVVPQPTQPVLGSVGDARMNSISSYVERMQLYFEANSVVDDRKVAVLLTVIGAKTYETLRSYWLLPGPMIRHTISWCLCYRNTMIRSP